MEKETHFIIVTNRNFFLAVVFKRYFKKASKKLSFHMANVCEPVALCTPQFVVNKKYFQYKCNKRDDLTLRR